MNCSKHTKTVQGVTDMKALATEIGDLHYQALFELLNELEDKLYTDGMKDSENGRVRLGGDIKTCQPSRF